MDLLFYKKRTHVLVYLKNTTPITEHFLKKLFILSLLLMAIFTVTASYGASLNPLSVEDSLSSSITDRDGNTYKTIKIGEQWWMAENLRNCTCTDSTAIKTLKVGVGDENHPVIYWYENNPQSQYSQIYGPLYNYVAMRQCDLCPKGWHIPSKAEWDQLVNNWRPPSQNTYLAWVLPHIAYQLKATGDELWINNDLATNSSGFSALPGGWVSNGSWHHHYLGKRSAWWTTTTNSNSPFLAQIGNGVGGIWIGLYSFSYSVSIRCVKDQQ